MQDFRRNNEGSSSTLLRGALITLALLFATLPALAQVSTASINGVIRDANGAVIPGATVVLHSVDTAVEHSSISNSSGEYVLTNINPGKYTLQATAAGFSPRRC